MQHDDRLTQWWNGLSAEEQAEALEAQQTGELTPSMQKSLRATGLVEPETKGKPQQLPRDLRDFLKMRH